MNLITYFSPFLVYIIYQLLICIHRFFIFQNRDRFDKAKVYDYIRNKGYLKNIITLLIDKATLLDVNGFHFLKGVNDSDSTWKPFSFLISALRFFAFISFAFIIVSMLFLSLPIDTSPYLIYILSVAKFVVFLMVFRSTLSYIINIIHWFRYKFFVLNSAKKEAKQENLPFDAWKLWFNDDDYHKKYIGVFVDKEKVPRLTKHVPLNIKIADLFKYISTDRSGTEKLIYFSIFATTVVNSLTLVERNIQTLGLRLNEDDVVNVRQVLPKILLRLFIITVIAFPIVCSYIGVIWIMSNAVFMILMKSLIRYIHGTPVDERKLWQTQLMSLFSFVLKNEYVANDRLTLKVNLWKSAKKQLLKKIFFPTGLIFVYAFLFTALFVIWFESKPDRYKNPDMLSKENSDVETDIDDGLEIKGTNVMDRLRRYTYLCKIFIIMIGFVVGSAFVINAEIMKPPDYLGNLQITNTRLMSNLAFGAIGLLVVCVIVYLLFY